MGGLTESYDGSSWTEVANQNTARYNAGEAGAGSQTSTLTFGGLPPTAGVALTEAWNGTSWTEVADLATARGALSQGTVGTSVTAIAISGGDPSVSAATEEWDVPDATKTFTAT